MKKRITFQVPGICLFLLLSSTGFSQTTNTKNINDTLPAQQKISPDTMHREAYYKAIVYFSAKGNQIAKLGTITNGSLNGLMEAVHKFSNGVEVGFESLEFINSNGVRTKIKEIPYHYDNLMKKVKPANQPLEEIQKLKTFSFSSGTIYFSGFGFRNVVSVQASDISTLYSYYSRSGPGTIITLDNCIFKNIDGKLEPISKTVMLE